LITWKQFSESNPSLAKFGEELLFQYGVGLAFLATIRKDGAPRLHPVCPVLSNTHLYVFILPGSPKRRDIQRDGRFALQAFPEDRPDSDEYYITGKAELIDDTEIFKVVFTDAKHRASNDEILFELFVDRVMHTKWEGFGTEDYRPIHTKWSVDT
jgi:hypothetical protein